MKRSTIVLLSLGSLFLLLLACIIIGGVIYFIFIRKPVLPTPTPIPTPIIEETTPKNLTKAEMIYSGDAGVLGYDDSIYFSRCPVDHFECDEFYILGSVYLLQLLEDPIIGYTYYISGNYSKIDENEYQLIYDESLVIEPALIPSDTRSYTNELFNISLEYPADWDLEEELTGTPGDCESFSLTISKGENIFGYYLPCASGIAVCIYEDTSIISEVPEYIEFSSYVPITYNDKTFRRSYDSENQVWNICELNPATNNYLSAVGLGNVYYYTPNPSSTETLNILDQILYSLEPIN